jgi:Cys-rich protein (TIGR01571 family)
MQLLSEGEMSSPALGTKFLIFFTIALLSLNAWTVVALIFIVNSPQLWLILSCTIPLGLLDIFVVGTLIMKTIKTRKAVREYFDIEEQNCNGSEDAFLGFFCACCTISQMGRHTADYATYREDIFSPTGLPRKLEMIVPTQTIKDRDSEQSIHSF